MGVSERYKKAMDFAIEHRGGALRMEDWGYVFTRTFDVEKAKPMYMYGCDWVVYLIELKDKRKIVYFCMESQDEVEEPHEEFAKRKGEDLEARLEHKGRLGRWPWQD
jgi:hypothetical protein